MFLRRLPLSTSTLINRTPLAPLSLSLSNMPNINRADRLKPFSGDSVWNEFTPLSQQYKSVNLGQGFPDWEPPAFVANALDAQKGSHQYTRSAGAVRLVNQLAKKYSVALKREVDPMSEVVVSEGATEGMFAIMQSYINPGDEVIMFEPAFDIYSSQVKMAGGVPVYVPMFLDEHQSWTFKSEDLASAFSSRTKAVVVNTPHNPCGKVFSRTELELISKHIIDHDGCVAVSDEVYEHMLRPGLEMERICQIDGMWERTLTMSSSGKTFSCTGWKIGWVVGHKDLISPLMTTQQWVQFSVNTPCQEAVATALEEAEKPYEGHENYYAWISSTYEAKRQRLTAMLEKAGLKPLVADGGFFVMADTTSVDIPREYLDAPNTTRDYAFCRWLTKEVGVTAIPPTAFYRDETKHTSEHLARFAACKSDEALAEAEKRFNKFFG